MECGRTQLEVFEELGIAQSVISRLWQRFQDDGNVSDRGLPGHEFEPSTTKDPPCRAAMHVKSVELKRPPVGVVW
ncbi:hypothetical protein TNCV_3787601 [Trichonephila clavipes]|nr:hypothetical protein TNCV_3407501 [Trichonephila clavipes]GFU18504.1 hypothetical protein TNCV_3787601 [Trichonephila clavipes]